MWRTGDISRWFEFWRFVFLFLWIAEEKKLRLDKGPGNGLPITSGLAFAERPYAKIENAKTMQKRGTPFRVASFQIILFFLCSIFFGGFCCYSRLDVYYKQRAACISRSQSMRKCVTRYYYCRNLSISDFFAPHKFTHTHDALLIFASPWEILEIIDFFNARNYGFAEWTRLTAISSRGMLDDSSDTAKKILHGKGASSLHSRISLNMVEIWNSDS